MSTTKKKIDLWPKDWFAYGIDWKEINRRGVLPAEAGGMVRAFQDMLTLYNKECGTHMGIGDFYWTEDYRVLGERRPVIINVTEHYYDGSPLVKFLFSCEASFYNMQDQLDYAAAHFRLLRAHMEGKTYVLCKQEVPTDETERLCMIRPEVWIPEGYELKKKG